MDCGADAVVQQVLDDVFADRGPLLHRLAVVHDDDADGLGLAQIGQRLGTARAASRPPSTRS